MLVPHRMHVFLSALLAASVFCSCSNYDLKDKLENPGGSSSGMGSARHYAFVTNQVTLGNMTGLVAGACGGTGLVRADCACTEIARMNGLARSSTSQFVAWLSTTANDMKCRLTGTTSPLVNCAQPTGGPTWYNTQDQVIANGFADLFDGSISAQPRYTEFKTSPAGLFVWSNTTELGLSGGGNDCLTGGVSWGEGTNAGVGARGDVGGTGITWTTGGGGTNTCDNSHHVYCFAMP